MYRNLVFHFAMTAFVLLAITGCKSQEEIGTVPTPRPASATTTEVVYLHQDKEEETRTVCVTGDGCAINVAEHAEISIALCVPVETEEEAANAHMEALQGFYRAVSRYNVRPMDFSASGMKLVQVEEEEGKGSTLCVSDDWVVTIRNVEAVEDVILALVEAGAEHTGEAVYYFADLSERYDEALRMAMEDAQRKAELLAVTCNFKLADILILEEKPYEQELLFRTKGETALFIISAGVRVTYIIN